MVPLVQFALCLSGLLLVIWHQPHYGAPLAALPGNHLVLVRYLPSHNVLQEWVYNEAEIDRAMVVWARDIPCADLNPLLAYFKDRNVWVVDADLSPPHLEPYRKPTAP